MNIVPDRKTGNILISNVEPKTDSMENASFRQKSEIARLKHPTITSLFWGENITSSQSSKIEKASAKETKTKFDLPQNYAIFEHTYTKHGQFFPLLQVTSSSGFKSKFYTTCNAPRSSYRELEGTFDLTATQTTGAAEQNLSIVSLYKSLP